MPGKEFVAKRSTYIENVMRHCFLYEVTRYMLSLPEPQVISILDSEVDSEGVDVILVHKTITRHIQLKTLSKLKTGNPYPISESLSRLPGACVLWICYDPCTMVPTAYHIMGGRGNAPMRDLTNFPMATKAKKEGRVPRVGHRAIRVRDANHLALTISQLVEILFDLGDAP